MLYKEAVKSLNVFLSSNLISTDFGQIETKEIFNDKTPLISKVNLNLPKDGAGHQSGVYLIYTEEGEIYYIGKATKNNLHEEVWGKIKTPTKHDDGTQSYPKNYFLNKKKLYQSAVNDITTGNVKIGVVVISNSLLSSLAEVYLQTLYCNKNSGNLPKLNSQVG